MKNAYLLLLIVGFIIFTAIVSTIGYFQKKSSYKDFVEFKKVESKTLEVKISEVYLNVSEISSNRVFGLVLKDLNQETYKVSFSLVSNEELRKIDLSKFKDATLTYFVHKGNKCFYSVSNNSEVLIKTQTAKSKLKPFQFFGSYSSTCHEL